MKTIIAGTRNIVSMSLLLEAIEESNFEITEVVCGDAKGADELGNTWGINNKINVKHFPADWKNIQAPGAIVKQNQYGKYNAKAGMDRNEQMACYSEALIALWDGKSRGTKNMIELARKHGLKIFIKTGE